MTFAADPMLNGDISLEIVLIVLLIYLGIIQSP